VATQNLIQRPDIASRLAKALGLVQMHIAPTLAETVQPVAIVANVSDTPPSPAPVDHVLSFVERTLDALAIDYNLGLFNPTGSNVIARVTHVELQAINSEHVIETGINTEAYHLAAYPGVTPTGTTFFRDIRKSVLPQLQVPRVVPVFFVIDGPISPPQRRMGRRLLRSESYAESPRGYTREHRELWIPPGWALGWQNTSPLVEGDGIRAMFAWSEEPVTT